jgi:hypothetical protein
LLKTEKERIVAELADRLAATETLIVADYRGLTNKELEALRARLTQHGARFSVVKNTLTRRAAESAGADSLLALLEGRPRSPSSRPTGIRPRSRRRSPIPRATRRCSRSVVGCSPARR